MARRYVGLRSEELGMDIVNSNQVTLASKTKKHVPTYYLTVTTTSSSSAAPSTWQIEAPFATWFTSDGYFVAQPFQAWLASSVNVIGDVDSKNAGRDEGSIATATNGAPTTSGSEAVGTASKRQKKKA